MPAEEQREVKQHQKPTGGAGNRGQPRAQAVHRRQRVAQVQHQGQERHVQTPAGARRLPPRTTCAASTKMPAPMGQRRGPAQCKDHSQQPCAPGAMCAAGALRVAARPNRPMWMMPASSTPRTTITRRPAAPAAKPGRPKGIPAPQPLNPGTTSTAVSPATHASAWAAMRGHEAAGAWPPR